MSYWSNQIIWDIGRKRLVQLKGTGVFYFGVKLPKRHCHLKYVKDNRTYVNEGGMAGAKYLLEQGEIAPARTT